MEYNFAPHGRKLNIPYGNAQIHVPHGNIKYLLHMGGRIKVPHGNINMLCMRVYLLYIGGYVCSTWEHAQNILSSTWEQVVSLMLHMGEGKTIYPHGLY